jgi:hypothetical protein
MLAEDAELAERAAYLFSMEQLVLPDLSLLQYLPRGAPEAWRMSEVCIARSTLEQPAVGASWPPPVSLTKVDALTGLAAKGADAGLSAASRQGSLLLMAVRCSCAMGWGMNHQDTKTRAAAGGSTTT